MREYAIVIEHGKHNLSAYVPDLPGCITTGRTMEEIESNIREAIELHLEGLARRVSREADMRSGILYIALLLLGPPQSGLSQSLDQRPRFDVVSVKSGKPGTTPSRTITPGRYSCIGCPLQGPIQFAFRLPQYLLSNAPMWLNSEPFDIAATMPANTSDATLRLMIQDLLQTRFHLTAHREKKEIPVYALVQARNGPKFQTEKREKREGDGRMGGGGAGRLAGIKVSAADFAELLSYHLGRPVLDQTGIDGLFDFKLIWTPDETQRSGVELSTTELHAPTDPNGPSIFGALQEQLGLRLIPQRGSVDIFVIDGIDRVPREN
jgi:uncharacterized protein (TIGR03435 family)